MTEDDPGSRPAGGVTVSEGDLLFEPSAERRDKSHLTRYMAWLAGARELVFETYDELWAWSVSDLDGFWGSIWDYFEVPADRPEVVLRRGPEGVAGAHWFEGAELNYVEMALDHPADDLAVVAIDEDGEIELITYGELRDLVASVANGLRRLGVERGDRVAAVVPNNAAAVVGFLATASIGAIWSSCAPEFGAASMIDRFQQIAPKALIAADGYRYNGRHFAMADKVRALAGAIPGLSSIVIVNCLPGVADPDSGEAPLVVGTSAAGATIVGWNDLLAAPSELGIAAVPFEHPLWILYSSGTTGLPKPIVHGHGGIVLEHLKSLSLHLDLGVGDRFFWYSTTGWMMWNLLVGGLLVGTTIVCYDGSPAWPDQGRLFRIARDVGITCLGTSAPFIESCRKAGLTPGNELDLTAVRTVGSTGAPLSPEGFAWASSALGDDVLVGSVSGGTDVCTAFVGSCPLLPVHAGELQCRALGAKVESFDADGRACIGEVGELVVTEPMPSMPTGLWGDDDGSRLHASYFAEIPGVWRHGDWVKITARGSCVVYGRSDATLNRGGVRMGTAEFYRVVEALPGVADTLIVDTSRFGTEGELVLFVVRAGRDTTDGELEARIRTTVREHLSPRHIPDRVLFVDALPRTLNGKKVEVPVRKILLGTAPAAAVSTDALADPGALDALLHAVRSAGLA